MVHRAQICDKKKQLKGSQVGRGGGQGGLDFFPSFTVFFYWRLPLETFFLFLKKKFPLFSQILFQSGPNQRSFYFLGGVYPVFPMFFKNIPMFFNRLYWNFLDKTLWYNMISSNVNERKRGIFVGDLASIAIIHRYKHFIFKLVFEGMVLYVFQFFVFLI